MKRFPPRKEFVAWLRAQPGGRVAGRRSNACDCPMTRWLQQCGFTGAKVFGRIWRWNGETGTTAFAPKWVKPVVDAIDGSGADETGITARTVLQLIGEKT